MGKFIYANGEKADNRFKEKNQFKEERKNMFDFDKPNPVDKSSNQIQSRFETLNDVKGQESMNEQKEPETTDMRENLGNEQEPKERVLVLKRIESDEDEVDDKNDQIK